MRAKKSIVILLLIVLAVMSVAETFVFVSDADALPRGISRANCLMYRNESITWEGPWWNYWFFTYSFHYLNGRYQHYRSNGWHYGAFDTAGDWDWKPFYNWWSWYVFGVHYYYEPSYGTIRLPNTDAHTCKAWSW